MIPNSKTIIIIAALIAIAVLLINYQPLQAAVMHIVYSLRWTDGLVGYWSFDGPDMTGLALDRSGQGNDGNLVGGISTTTQRVPGIIGQALKFDGSDDWINVTSAGDDINTSAGTYALWMKREFADDEASADTMIDFRVDSENNMSVYHGGGADRWAFQYKAGNTLTFVAPDIGNIPQYTWTYVAMTWDTAADEVKAYIDGSQASSTVTGLGTWSGSITSGGIGCTVTGSNLYLGLLDEVRVYNRALSSEEILWQYKRTAPQYRSTVKSVNRNGLIGYWNFDGCDSCSTAYDKSGQNNNGTFTDNAAHTADGKINRGATFDGSGDYISTANDPYSNAQLVSGTMTAWVKFSSLPALNDGAVVTDIEGYIELGYGKIVTNNVEQMKVRYYDSAERNINLGVPSLDTWYHLAVTWNGTLVKGYLDGAFINSVAGSSINPNSVARPFRIGAASWAANTLELTGQIDEVRVYGRVLSADEIKNIYQNEAKQFYINTNQNNKFTNGLVGFWSFNGPDMTGLALDRSGQGNDGNLVGGISTTTQRVPGIIGQALKFDGVNDYVVLPDIGIVENSAHTISFWAKTDSGTSASAAYSEGTPADWTNNLFIIYFADTGVSSNPGVRVYYRDSGAVGGSIIDYDADLTGEWHHVTYVQESLSSRILYVDGAVATSTDTTTRNALVVTSASIGAANNNGTYSQFSNANLDEVRIYNRALSPAEIFELYKSGRR